MKAVVHWSGGKDSALALYRLQQEASFEIVALVTTLADPYRRVSMHGVREVFIDQQASQLDLPLRKLLLPESPTMEAYNAAMDEAMRALRVEGVTHAVFGDIFLEDLRTFREQQMQQAGLQTLFPLWGEPTGQLLEEFVTAGFRALVVSYDADLFTETFGGQELDAAFAANLPAVVDPCGENGEFHTFVYDGPNFAQPISFLRGSRRKVGYPDPEEAEGEIEFWFQDLLPT